MHEASRPISSREVLRVRGIDEREVDRAWAVLSSPDPAGQLHGVTREQVAEVGTYLHFETGGVWLPSANWRLLVEGHPAARAV